MSKIRIVKLKKKTAIIGASILLLLVGVGLGATYVWSRSSVNQPEDVAYDFNENLSAAEERARDVTIQAGDGTNETKVSASAAALNQLKDSASSTEDKIVYLDALVELYQSSNKLDDALMYAKQLYDVDSSSQGPAKLAGVYFAMSKYQEAARFYGEAAERSERPANETVDSPYNDYMNRKKEAEAQI